MAALLGGRVAILEASRAVIGPIQLKYGHLSLQLEASGGARNAKISWLRWCYCESMIAKALMLWLWLWSRTHRVGRLRFGAGARAAATKYLEGVQQHTTCTSTSIPSDHYLYLCPRTKLTSSLVTSLSSRTFSAAYLCLHLLLGST